MSKYIGRSGSYTYDIDKSLFSFIRVMTLVDENDILMYVLTDLLRLLRFSSPETTSQ